MANPTVTDYLKYANLQMAAEAFIRNPDTGVLSPTGSDLIKALTAGNNHSSRFTQTQAEAFADPVKGWTVLDQKVNTGTGFSGTLFRNNATGELVLSFRSTEFIDDAARDNKATNELEIKDTGWAWGQLADMEAWYAQLATLPEVAGKPLSVTGYSLGGHLATAFNLLHGGSVNIKEVVTFNGAGVGYVKQGTLRKALDKFSSLRNDSGQIAAIFSHPDMQALYLELSTTPLLTRADVAAARQRVVDFEQQHGMTSAGNLLIRALEEIDSIKAEVARLPELQKGGSGGDATSRPKPVPDNEIDAETLNYRMAVKLAAANTESASLAGGAAQGYLGKRYLSPRLTNQFDVMGDTTPSMVANSQWHYGENVPVFIAISRRWRHGEGGFPETNCGQWRTAA